jgi:choline dehydrogenase-like flavoprotein
MGVYDVIIIGSGAGGAAAAYQLTQSGQHVLLLEKGLPLPRDGSTQSVDKVLRQGAFQNHEPWADKDGRTIVPPLEFANLGGKTKWYGAALLRFSPHEFGADLPHQCPAWPITYDDLAPYYEEAERLLGLRYFPVEADLQRIVAGLKKRDRSWENYPMPLGASADILDYPDEAKHFDAFASAKGVKADAETCFLDRIKQKANFELLTGKRVKHVLGDTQTPSLAVGVECDDGTRHMAQRIVLAGGALNSPRLLADFCVQQGLDRTLPSYRVIGRNYKTHLNSALVTFSATRKTDIIRKTLLLTSQKFPHSSVQNTGWLDGDIFKTQLPSVVPHWVAALAARHAYGFWVTTEDGSHPENRVYANGDGRPHLDFDRERVAPAEHEHLRLLATLKRELLGLGYLPYVKRMPVEITSHACGTLAAGNDPRSSVVNANGKVHGLDNVYVADGSVLTRSARVNPALTIYSWGLRLGAHIAHLAHLTKGVQSVAKADPVRA